MPSYDPQRNRPRHRPGADEPAPVDALLGDVEALPDPAGAAHVHAGHDHGDHDHDHHDHDHHDHDHGEADDIALVPIAIVVGALGGAFFVWRRWRRRRAAG